MKKINLIVLDTCPIIHTGFKGLFKDSSKFKLIQSYDSVYDFKEFIKSNNIDIVITEMELIDGNAFDILKSIKLVKREIPVLIFTNKSEKMEMEEICLFALDDSWPQHMKFKPVSLIMLMQLNAEKYLKSISKWVDYKKSRSWTLRYAALMVIESSINLLDAYVNYGALSDQV